MITRITDVAMVLGSPRDDDFLPGFMETPDRIRDG
jgi:hypothetical protein